MLVRADFFFRRYAMHDTYGYHAHGRYKFIFMFGMGASGASRSDHRVVVDYRTRGYARNLYDALSNIYRRGRVTGRTRRLMLEIQDAVAEGRLPVVIANSHGAVVTANAVRALADAGFPYLHRVSVYTLGAPRMVPWKTQTYELRDCVNVIHQNDHVFKIAKKMRWWNKRATTAPVANRVQALVQNGKMYKYVVTAAPVEWCRNVHVCLDLLPPYMPADVAHEFAGY